LSLLSPEAVSLHVVGRFVGFSSQNLHEAEETRRVKVGVSEERPVKEQTYSVKVEQARSPRIIVKAETSAILVYHCESLNKRESRGLF
jgi:hypothetical protein